jgi:DNA-directed RNA polymerase beta' subunit
MYDAQTHYNNIYTELKNILSKKKGDIRSSIGGRYAFSSRSVITQGTDLMPDQVRLPYHGLCELLQQVIINILVRTYNCSYANAYKRWYKAQLTFDQVVYDIIDGLIKDSNKGLPILINY